ncbi:hypothetical protein E2C01_022729 [Portunus trituberculatus]|uniref:Uncharacterized protein n=1 Tax=Portunus trituberculatus TaxID=210409 RepID=A0A5B7E8X2_PORTR|nr:hypothetical protein [Portunus trituberculatus]
MDSPATPPTKNITQIKTAHNLHQPPIPCPYSAHADNVASEGVKYELHPPEGLRGGAGASGRRQGHQHYQISRVSYLSSKVFQDGSAIDCRRSSNSAMASGPVLQMSVDTTHRELKAGSKQLVCVADLLACRHVTRYLLGFSLINYIPQHCSAPGAYSGPGRLYGLAKIDNKPADQPWPSVILPWLSPCRSPCLPCHQPETNQDFTG